MPYLIHAKFEPNEQSDMLSELLIKDIFFILLGNAFATPLSKIFDVQILLKWYHRRRILKGATSFLNHSNNINNVNNYAAAAIECPCT